MNRLLLSGVAALIAACSVKLGTYSFDYSRACTASEPVVWDSLVRYFNTPYRVICACT